MARRRPALQCTFSDHWLHSEFSLLQRLSSILGCHEVDVTDARLWSESSHSYDVVRPCPSSICRPWMVDSISFRHITTGNHGERRRPHAIERQRQTLDSEAVDFKKLLRGGPFLTVHTFHCPVDVVQSISCGSYLWSEKEHKCGTSWEFTLKSQRYIIHI